jgi:hypothetical protein
VLLDAIAGATAIAALIPSNIKLRFMSSSPCGILLVVDTFFHPLALLLQALTHRINHGTY